MKNILLDISLRFIYNSYTVNTTTLVIVKNYSIKQKEKRVVSIFNVLSNCGCYYF